jgi:hypothetical protein
MVFLQGRIGRKLHKLTGYIKYPNGPESIEILVLERVCLSCTCKHFGQKNLVKSLLISTLDKVIYCIGTFLKG